MYSHIGTETRPEFLREAAVGNTGQCAKAWSGNVERMNGK